MRNVNPCCVSVHNATPLTPQSYPELVGSYRMDLAYIMVAIVLLVGCTMFVIHTMVMALSPVHSRGTLVNMVYALWFSSAPLPQNTHHS